MTEPRKITPEEAMEFLRETLLPLPVADTTLTLDRDLVELPPRDGCRRYGPGQVRIVLQVRAAPREIQT